MVIRDRHRSHKSKGLTIHRGMWRKKGTRRRGSWPPPLNTLDRQIYGTYAVMNYLSVSFSPRPRAVNICNTFSPGTAIMHYAQGTFSNDHDDVQDVIHVKGIGRQAGSEWPKWWFFAGRVLK